MQFNKGIYIFNRSPGDTSNILSKMKCKLWPTGSITGDVMVGSPASPGGPEIIKQMTSGNWMAGGMKFEFTLHERGRLVIYSYHGSLEGENYRGVWSCTHSKDQGSFSFVVTSGDETEGPFASASLRRAKSDQKLLVRSEVGSSLKQPVAPSLRQTSMPSDPVEKPDLKQRRSVFIPRRNGVLQFPSKPEMSPPKENVVGESLAGSGSEEFENLEKSLDFMDEGQELAKSLANKPSKDENHYPIITVELSISEDSAIGEKSHLQNKLKRTENNVDRKKERDKIRERRLRGGLPVENVDMKPEQRQEAIKMEAKIERVDLKSDSKIEKIELKPESKPETKHDPKPAEIPQSSAPSRPSEAAEERRRRIEKVKQEIEEKKKILALQAEEERRKLQQWEQSFSNSLAGIQPKSPVQNPVIPRVEEAIRDWEIKKGDILFSSPRVVMEAQARKIPLSEKTSRYPIGKGGFGAIYLVEYNSTLAAMKVLESNRDQDTNQEFVHELDMLLRLRHPNVILYLGGSVGKEELFFLTELMECDLNKMIKQKDPRSLWQNDGRFYAADIIQAITYIHKIKLVHKDVKTPNVLINRGCAKLGDFGLAKLVGNTINVTQDRAYSAAWASPEQINPKSQIAFPTDIYSFAIIIWEIFAQQEPWEGFTNLQLMFATATGQFKDYHPFPPETPRELIQLCQKSWNLAPQERPTAEQFLLEIEKFTKLRK